MDMHATKATCLVILVLLLGGCYSDVDPEEQGRFVLANASGHALTLNVYATRTRGQVPLVVPVADGGHVERLAGGGAGAIVVPELALWGDSVCVVFDNGKQILHYCPALEQGSIPCMPTESVLNLEAYHKESLSMNVQRYTYTFTPADYARAQ